MEIRENVPLSTLTTMRVGGTARYAVTATDLSSLRESVAFAGERDLPWFVMGMGSNVVARGDYKGVIILNRIAGFEQIDETSIKVGAGEIWDSVVNRVCARGLSGVECMSLIPGYAGAMPVQNAGAYGQDISGVLVELSALDTTTGDEVILGNSDCKFGYRTSIFKTTRDRRYVITSLTLGLSSRPPSPPFYPALQQYLDENGIENYTPESIRAAVIAVRRTKLPDVDKVGSAGSFFKNPIVNDDVARRILDEFPEAPHWSVEDGRVKLAAGWLIDTAGLRGYENDGFQLYPKNALVVVNRGGDGDDLTRFKCEIVERIRDRFGVTLEQEPESL